MTGPPFTATLLEMIMAFAVWRSVLNVISLAGLSMGCLHGGLPT